MQYTPPSFTPNEVAVFVLLREKTHPKQVKSWQAYLEFCPITWRPVTINIILNY